MMSEIHKFANAVSFVLAIVLFSISPVHSYPARARSYHHPKRFAVSMIGGDYGRSSLPPKKDFKTLQPLPCTGEFTLLDGAKSASVFLAPRKMEVEQYDDFGAVLVYDVLPILISVDLESALVAAGTDTNTPFPPPGKSGLGRDWPRGCLTDRNYGFFDGLLDLPIFEETSVSQVDRAILRASPNLADTAARPVIPRKLLYNYIHRRISAADAINEDAATVAVTATASGKKLLQSISPPISPYHTMVDALSELAGLKVSGLLLEVRENGYGNNM